MFVAVTEFLFRYKRKDYIEDTIRTFTLLNAVRYGYSDVVTSLLLDEHSINPATRSSTQLRIHIAAKELASQFLSGTLHYHTFTSHDYQQNSLFLWAAGNGHKKVAVLLLKQKGLVADENDIEHWLSPCAAAHRGMTEAIDIMIKEGKIDATWTDGALNILQLAAQEGHTAIVELLLQAGADVNAKYSTDSGPTALQLAVEGGHLAVIERLLQAGAGANAEPSLWNGRTALQAAAGGGHLAVVERLRQAGATM